MDKTNAFNVIDQVISNYRGTRQEHQTLVDAMNTIKRELFAKRELPDMPSQLDVPDSNPEED